MEQAKFEAFRSEAVAKGSDEVLVREWHSERYGDAGATLWVGRRHAKNDG